jgi:uncharacterized protein YbjT (DUF2867 family)
MKSTEQEMILVTAATGTLGSEVVKQYQATMKYPSGERLAHCV